MSDSKERKVENLVVIETKKIFLTLLNVIKNEDVEALFVTENFFENNKKLLSKFYDRINICKDKVFDSISNLKTPDGIICVLRFKPKKITFNPNKNYIALYEIQNPKNLGAIIRSCLAFNIAGLYLIGKCCDIFHPEVIRSSMGYVFNIPVEKFNNFEYFLAQIKKNKINLLATANDKDAIDLCSHKSYKNNCFIIGNEGNGLPSNIIKQCTKTIRIPLGNNVESLNAAVATAIVAFYLNNGNN